MGLRSRVFWRGSLFVGLALVAGSLVVSQRAPASRTSDDGTTTLTRAEVPMVVAPELLVGPAAHETLGTASVYVPPRLAVRDGRVDLLVHFHGLSDLQEKNVEEAGLSAVVVSVNEGVGSDAYSRAVASPGALDALIDKALRVARTSRATELEPGRIALSGWSAGGAAVKTLLARDPTRIDAAFVADGIFSTFDESGEAAAPGPLAAYVAYAERARAGEALFVLTHTAIDTVGYPSTRLCTAKVLSALGLSPAAALEGQVYDVEQGGLVIRGRDGKGKEAHIDEIRALDEAYVRLARRWQ